MLKSVTDLAGEIAERADEIERERKLPDDLARKLKQAGAFRALIPQSYGGLGVPFDEYVHMVQTMAEADASTAWCINQAAVIGLTSLWLPEQAPSGLRASAERASEQAPSRLLEAGVHGAGG